MSSEVSETKRVDVDKTEKTNYVDIKPESDMSPTEAKKSINVLFSEEIEDNKTNTSEVQENPHQEIVDGKTYYYDDNGDLYRVDNKLAPSTKYEINGYKYETDDQGRIISASGKLKMRDPGYTRKMEKVQDYEGQDYQEGDDRGHLIGHQFGGSDRLENLVPQDAKINQNDFRNFECELSKEVKDGKDVEVVIEPIYEGDSNRPVAIVVTYSIDGEENVRIFPNSQEE